MMFLSRAESSYLHQHLSVVRHVTLDPEGPGVLRIHLLPCKKARRNVPFVALLNGQDILPLSVSWAILLAGLMDALQPFEGKEITEDQWAGIAAQAVETAAAVYPKTAPDQIRADLNAMLTSFRALTAGQEPPVHVQPMDLGAYARYMAAPHRMDLMVSSMEKDGAWHCNQKCLHCYAANQPLGAVKELDTDQWLAVIQKCRAAGIPQLTFTGGEPTMRNDLVSLVHAAQWFVTRLNTNGRMLTSALCRELADASLDSVQVTLYSADEAIHNTLVGAPGYADTISGIRNAVEAGLNVSINTPLCSLNQDYTATLALANSLGVRYATCSGLIPTGGAETDPSKATRLTPEALTAVLRPAMAYAEQNHMEINFTSPGWLPDAVLLDLGFTQVPSCGACLSNMAVAPDGTVLPCQSWLREGAGLGNILHDSLGVRYATCSGLIPTGGAETDPSKATRLTPEALTAVLRPAMAYAEQNHMEINFTSPGWLPDAVLLDLGFTQVPSCGACLSNMAVAPDGTVLPCQSWLREGAGLGNILHDPWHKIWNAPACRRVREESAKMEHICQLGTTVPAQGGL